MDSAVTIQVLDGRKVDVDAFAEYDEELNLFRVTRQVVFVFPSSWRVVGVEGDKWHSIADSKVGMRVGSEIVVWEDDAGRIVVEVGYTWDGPSGPTFDTPVTRYPSLIHDLICTTIDGAHVIDGYFKRHWVYYALLREQGAPLWRAQLHWHALNVGNWAYSLLNKRKQA
jgi:hypothetical protein